MSLITLTSRENVDNPNSNDPSILRNHYKDGIKLRKGDQIGLVSLTFNKLPMLEIVQGENDTFTWRIGDRQNYLNHKVVIPPGEYTGNSLATQIQKSLNDSTILGNYKGKWVCVFDSQLFQGNGGISIEYGQNDVPTQGQNTTKFISGVLPLQTTSDGATSSTIHGSIGSNNLQTQVSNDIFSQQKGIFPNDGQFELEIKPIQGITKANFQTAFNVGGGDLFNTNQIGNNRLFQVVVTTGTAASNGWHYEAQYENGDPSDFWRFIGQSQEGAVGIGIDSTLDATQSSSYRNTVFYNNTNKTFRDAVAGGRTNENGPDLGEVWTKDGASPQINITFSGVGYGQSISGLVRNQLFNGKEEYPGDPNAQINNTFPSGFDYMFRVKDNSSFDNIEVSLGQLIKRQGVSFPNAGWRDDSRPIFSNVSPNSWNTSLSGTAPANWSNFVYGTSNIKLSIFIRKVRTIEFKISHDGAGAGIFQEEVKLSKTGDTPNTVQQTSNVKEWFFPYRPVMNVNKGGRYGESRYISQGIFDSHDASQVNSGIITSGNTALYLDREQAEDGSLHIEDNHISEGVSSPSNAQTLSAIIIFGAIIPSDIEPNGTLPAGDVPTNRSENNISELIGFHRFVINSAGQSSNTYSSIVSVDTIIREPNLMVELVDFNIEAHNGDTSMKSKIIAVIPSEELNTNSRSGQLNYYSHYPIMIDLNIEYDYTVYDLNATLRTPDGKIPDNLINPTSITLMKKESEESRQKRLMDNMKEDIISTIANKQEIKIDSIGRDFPRI